MAFECVAALCSSLTRKKAVKETLLDSQTRRYFTTLDLTFLGAGCVIGAGLFVVTGDAFRSVTGPSIILSFVVVATSALLSAMCYAELSSRVPKIGSAYVYTYVSVGEIWAFIVGWTMVSEYILAAAVLARACSEYINSLSNGEIFDSFSKNFVSLESECLGRFPDLLALFLSVAATVLLAFGPRKASVCNIVATAIALVAVVFIIAGGIPLMDKTSWTGHFAPNGAVGVLRAAGSLAFIFIGLDAVTLASQEAVNPRMSIPLSLTMSYTVSLLAYCGAAVVMILIMPFGDAGHFVPIAEAFAQKGFMVGKYVTAAGGMFATAGSLVLTTYAASRLLFTMATDGLVFRWLAHTDDELSQIPGRATLLNGVVIGCLALLVDIRCLVELLSIGTLIAFISMNVSVLSTRYQVGIESVTLEEEQPADSKAEEWLKRMCCVTSQAQANYQRIMAEGESTGQPDPDGPTERSSRQAAIAIFLLFGSLTGIAIFLPRLDLTESHGQTAWQVFVLSLLLLLVLFLLMSLAQQPSSAKLPFMVPLVPCFPAAAMFVNVVLLVSLNPMAFIRFGVWLFIGEF